MSNNDLKISSASMAGHKFFNAQKKCLVKVFSKISSELRAEQKSRRSADVARTATTPS